MTPSRWHGCEACVELQRLAIRRRDRALIEAAESLSREHLAADAERDAFAEACRAARARNAQPRETAPARDRVTLLIGEGSDPAIQTRFPRKA